jgi:hypothetical protein
MREKHKRKEKMKLLGVLYFECLPLQKKLIISEKGW